MEVVGFLVGFCTDISARGEGLKRQTAIVFYLRALWDLGTEGGSDGEFEVLSKNKLHSLGFGDFFSP